MEINKYIRRIILVIACLYIIKGVAIDPCIAATSQVLPIYKIKKMIKTYVVTHTSWKENQIHIDNINIPGKIVIPTHAMFNMAPAPNSTLVGKTAFAINVYKKNGSIQTYWITADIGILVDVVLASRPMEYHHIINKDDVYIGKKDLNKLLPGYITNLSEVIGKRVKRFISLNRPITTNMIEESPLFTRGAKVFIIAESDTVKVTAIGIAKEDGYRDKLARVMNIQSKKEVIGKVIGDNTIKVTW